MSRYLIVDAKILPDYFEKVLSVRLEAKENPEASISALCEKAGISRSTYYKYKDHIFDSNKEMNNRKAEIHLSLNHKQGVLKEVMEKISLNGGNIITIFQAAPLNNSATLTMQIDVRELKIDIRELVNELSDIDNVKRAKLLSVE